jgi:hypothetical protein
MYDNNNSYCWRKRTINEGKIPEISENKRKKVKNILDLSHLIMSCENAVPSFRFHE